MIRKQSIAAKVDHTVLKATTTKNQVLQYCREAKEKSFASVCINPYFVKMVAEELKGTDVKVCTVIGFPLGANTTEVKAFEAKKAVADGAHEVDMVINVGALKDKDHNYVEADIRAVVEASIGAIVKVIIETCYLTDEEKEVACKLAQKAGADFVKTSTGFGTGGATIEDVRLMRRTVGNKMQVKASGGIRALQDALNMIEAGADRLGTSSGLSIISEISE